MRYVNYHESRKRGTTDFPLEFHHVSPLHPQYIMTIHWHVEFEILRVLKGCFELNINDQSFTVNAGGCALIPAGALHSGIPGSGCIYECIVFDMNLLMNTNDACRRHITAIMNHDIEPQFLFPCSYTLTGTPDFIPFGQPDSIRCPTGYDNIHRIVWTMFDAAASGAEGYTMIVIGALYQLFGTIIASKYYNPVPEHTPHSHKRILQLKQAQEFMENHYNGPLTLQEIAGSVQMSPKYFCRFFHEMTHMTPISYLNYYRIEQACCRLTAGGESVTEVAYSSGFNDLSYFIKTFRKYKGVTPKQYVRI